MLQTLQSSNDQIVAPNDLISSVQRSFQILELLAQNPDGLNAKQISLKCQLNLSTSYHLINTLMACGYVIKDPDTLLFRQSGKIGYTALDQVSPAQIVRQLRVHVETLGMNTHETAYLSIWDHQEIVLSLVAESPLSVRVKALEIGFCEANHATALGKAILSHLDEATLEIFLSDHQFKAYTPNSITDTAHLRNELKTTRSRGYSLDIEEYLPDVCCIGAPIFDARKQVCASLAIAIPNNRYISQLEINLPQVIEAARAASRTMRILGHIGCPSQDNELP